MSMIARVNVEAGTATIYATGLTFEHRDLFAMPDGTLIGFAAGMADSYLYRAGSMDDFPAAVAGLPGASLAAVPYVLDFWVAPDFRIVVALGDELGGVDRSLKLVEVAAGGTSAESQVYDLPRTATNPDTENEDEARYIAARADLPIQVLEYWFTPAEVGGFELRYRITQLDPEGRTTLIDDIDAFGGVVPVYGGYAFADGSPSESPIFQGVDSEPDVATYALGSVSPTLSSEAPAPAVGIAAVVFGGGGFYHIALHGPTYVTIAGQLKSIGRRFRTPTVQI